MIPPAKTIFFPQTEKTHPKHQKKHQKRLSPPIPPAQKQQPWPFVGNAVTPVAPNFNALGPSGGPSCGGGGAQNHCD